MNQGAVMTLLKQLLPLAALLLLSIVPTETEVVTSVEDCNEFFLKKTPPNITRILGGGKILNQSRYKLICQTLNNTTTFVTLYDTQNKIPVFSAAKFNGSTSGRPQVPWMIEPQLENPSDNPNMRPSNNSTNYKHQAGDKDYKNTGFSRGHLFPSSYGSTVLKRNSTFTLTNIVPQNKDFNSGSWNKMENCIKCVLNEYCKNNSNIEGFVVIGAQPSNNRLNQIISIPSVLWSTFCCYSQIQNSWLASAHWGNNRNHGPEHLDTKTLGELYTELGIEVFPETQCPKNTTVTHLYSHLPSNCSCPSKMSSKSVQSTYFSSPETSVPLSTTSGKSTTAPMSTTIASVKKFKVNVARVYFMGLSFISS
ncbi:endonuclease domain-containing 1 protein-like isoform X2 [Haplochromis burtoni]|nr:endonuclease domain-containing 1 protein-like isoform X2 [Haplochromis burtoni]